MSDSTDGISNPNVKLAKIRERLSYRLRWIKERSAILLPKMRTIAVTFGAWAWDCLKRRQFWFGVASLAVFVYVADFVYDIFVDDSYLVLNEDDIGIAWVNGVARLGIRPVYPPQEDLRVGDIFAIVSETSDNVPVLSKAVRLETLDLRSEIAKGDRFRPTFPDTPTNKETKDHAFRTIARKELGPIIRQPTNRNSSQAKERSTEEEKEDKAQEEKKRAEEHIQTSITAFPGFSIQHVRRSSGSWGLGSMLFGGDRKAGEVEHVRIKEVETYGAPAWETLGRLYQWCRAEGQDFCADDFLARKFLSHALPLRANVLEVKNCKYTSRVELIMISRVFMTREIDSQRWLMGSRGAQLDLKAKPTASPSAAKAATSTSPHDTTDSAPSPEGSEVGTGGISSFSSDKTQMGLQGIFQKPLIFGYRSVSIALDRSPPKPPEVEKPCPAEAKAASATATASGSKP